MNIIKRFPVTPTIIPSIKHIRCFQKCPNLPLPTPHCNNHSTQGIPITDASNSRNTEPDGMEDTNPKEKEALPISAMPGPGGVKRIPYIGTLFLFQPFTKYTLETFGKLACDMHDVYGPVFRTRLGKNYAVHTCSIDDIENIFRQESKYPKRRLMNLSRVYRERCGLPQSLGSCNGEQWYALRKPLNVTLKRPKAVQSYLPSLNKVADDFVQRLLEVEGKDETERAEEMFKLFFKYSSEGVGVACFNERLGFLSDNSEDNPEKIRLLEAFRTSVKCTFRDIMGLERRYMKTDNDPFYQTYYECMRYIRQQSTRYVKRVIPSATDKEVNFDDDDDKSNLLKTMVRRKDLNMEQILAIIDSLLIGGTDSTARILAVLLYDMAQNPDIQGQIALEVRQFAGPDGPVTNECVAQVRLLRACVKESMRVHYPVSSGVERILQRDTVVSGYLVPEGTSVFMTGVKTSQDPKHFPNPKAFVPERWLKTANHISVSISPPSQLPPNNDGNNNNLTQIHTNSRACPSTGFDFDSNLRSSSSSAFAFIPFGHGARSCIGSRFAEMELLVGLAKVLQKLNVSVHPSYQSLEVNYTPFITPLKPIPFIFTKR